MNKFPETVTLEHLEIRLQNISALTKNYIQTKWDGIIDFTGDDPYIMWVYWLPIYTMVYYWIFGALFTFMDITGRPKFLQKYKIRPGSNERVETGKLLNTILLVLFNQTFVTLPLSYVVFYYITDAKTMPPIREIPTVFRFITDILAFSVLGEIYFYYIHRLLHSKYFFKYIHKEHHEWTSTISIITEYNHPIEHLFSNIFSVSIGVVVMNSHYITAFVWYIAIISITMCHHSGYWMPLLLNPEFHDFHHTKFNYCYGITGLIDRLHGTDSLFRELKAAKKEKLKKQ